MTEPRKRLLVEEAVEIITADLPEEARELIRKEAAWAAGHDNNSQACYAGNCTHDSDVAEAMVKAYRLGIQHGLVEGLASRPALNEKLTPDVHVEADGLAWWQKSNGHLVIGAQRAGKTYKPLAEIQVPDLEDDAAAWRIVRRWLKEHGPAVGVHWPPEARR